MPKLNKRGHYNIMVELTAEQLNMLEYCCRQLSMDKSKCMRCLIEKAHDSIERKERRGK